MATLKKKPQKTSSSGSKCLRDKISTEDKVTVDKIPIVDKVTVDKIPIVDKVFVDKIPIVDKVTVGNAKTEHLHEERQVAKKAIAKSQKCHRTGLLANTNFTKLRKVWEDAISYMINVQDQFRACYTKDSLANNELYALLNTYLESRCRVVKLIDDLYGNVAVAHQEAQSLWVKRVGHKVFEGCCGDKKIVRVNREYVLHYLNEAKLSQISSTLAKNRATAYENVLPHIFDCQKIKSEIQWIIQRIFVDVSARKTQNGNIYFSAKNYVDNRLAHIHYAISILFHYLRKPVDDEIFVNDIKLWIQQLVAAQMHLSQPEGHWLILFNLLRCSNNMSWGIPMLQIPYIKANETFVPDVNICITLLKMITSPVKERDKSVNTKTNDSWVILDSDYDEECFVSGSCIGPREDDIIGLLNQIPFEDLFCSIMKVKKMDGRFKICEEYLSEMSVLEMFAFNSIVIETLGEGLTNYSEERYKLLRRRLALLILHCIRISHYVYQLFLKAANCDCSSSSGMRSSVFDKLVFVACKYLQQSKDSGVLQFIQFLPFDAIRETTLCAIYHYLNVGFPQEFNFESDELNVQYSQIQNRISPMVSIASAETLDYLLQIYLQMALRKNHIVGFKFVQIVCQHIFNIGYCDERTRSICNKACSNVLFALTGEYPQLIDDLITFLELNFATIERSESVYQSMELSKWQPNSASLDVLLQWLAKYSYDSKENGVARSILGHMNWGLGSEDRLFIAHHIHIRVAYGVLEAACNEIERTSNGAKYEIDKFINWCWNMVSLLHLHYLDQGRTVAISFLKDPTKYLINLPEATDIAILANRVAKEFPLAIYLSMLTSLNGHSIPLSCQRSFDQLQLLLLHKRYAPCIRSLQLLTVIFTEYADVLNECKSFQALLAALTQAEKSSVALSILFGNHPTSTVEMMKSMLQSQIINYADYGLLSCQPLVDLWLKSFLCLPNADNTSVLYLLDNILKVAYSLKCWQDAKETFISCYEKHRCMESPKSFTAHLFKKNVDNATFFEAYPWYVLMRLEVEHKILERDTKLWDEILFQVNISGLKFEEAFKTAVGITGSQCSYIDELTVVKYANIISVIRPEHILLPILSQQFFAIYLYRSCCLKNGERQDLKISNTVYNHNRALMLKMKTQFGNAAEYYNKKLLQNAEEGQEAPYLLHRNLNRLFTAYQIWLDDTIIRNTSLEQLKLLPMNFYPEKLTAIIYGEKNNWNEFLNAERIESELKCNADCWREHCFRSCRSVPKTESNVSVQASHVDPSSKIFTHLASYEKPCEFKLQTSSIGEVGFNNENMDLLKLVKTCFKDLLQYAKYLIKICKEMEMVDTEYTQKMEKMYKIDRKDEFKQVSCNSVFSSPFFKCSLPALIKITVEIEQCDQDIQDAIACNRKKHEELFNVITTEKREENISPLEILFYVARYLNDYYAGKSEEALLRTPSSKLFQCLFNELVENFKDPIVFSPLKEVYRKIISSSAIYMDVHQKTEGARMMMAVMQNTALFDVLADMINPMKGDFECFVNMYETLIEAHRQSLPLDVVTKLAPKFNMASCLVTFSPNATCIRILLKITFEGLDKYKLENLLHESFRRNLTDILKHRFPENMSEVLLATLLSCSQNKIDSCVIHDIVNSLVNCNYDEAFTAKISDIYTETSRFAKNQTCVDAKTATELITIIATHFQSERVKYGLHGLYPVYETYCEHIAILLACLSQTAIAASLKSLSDFNTEMFDRIIKSIFEVYSPWIMVYTKHHYQSNAEHWTCQLAEDGKQFFPWSEFFVKKAETILFSLRQTFNFLLPFGPEVMMSYIFDWYCDNVPAPKTPSFILEPLQNAFVNLEWQYFCPQPACLEKMHQIINKSAGNTDVIIGCIFLNVKWTKWFNNHFIRWKTVIQATSLKFLFFITVKSSLDPRIYSTERTKSVIMDLLALPWEEVSYEYVGEVFDWILKCKNPEIIFSISTGEEDTGKHLMRLLRRVSAMGSDVAANRYQLLGTRRRAYVHYIMNLLLVCASKTPAIIENNESRKKVQMLLMDTLTDIDYMYKIEIQGHGKKQNDEIFMLFKEVFSFYRFQNSSMTKLCNEAVSLWALNFATSSASIVQILNVISSTKSCNESMCSTLECILEAYLKLTANESGNAALDWNTIALKFGEPLQGTSCITLMREKNLLVMHLLIMYSHKISDMECKKNLVNDLINILKTLEANENLEMKIVNVWAATVLMGFQISTQGEMINKKLLEFARSLETYSKNFNSWKDGILMLVGLKQTTVTKKFVVVSQCLTCLIFDFFGESVALQTSIAGVNALMNANKEDELNVLILKALDVIEGKNRVFEGNSDKVIALVNTFYKDHVLNLIGALDPGTSYT